VALARRDRMTLIVSPQRPRDFVETLREELIRVAEERVPGAPQPEVVSKN
jgi:septum formation topological specificity factor MinE